MTEHESSALAGGFLTTEPPGKPTREHLTLPKEDVFALTQFIINNVRDANNQVYVQITGSQRKRKWTQLEQVFTESLTFSTGFGREIMK